MSALPSLFGAIRKAAPLLPATSSLSHLTTSAWTMASSAGKALTKPGTEAKAVAAADPSSAKKKKKKNKKKKNAQETTATTALPSQDLSPSPHCTNSPSSTLPSSPSSLGPSPLRLQLERLKQGCQGVGPLDPLVSEMLEQMVKIDEVIRAERRSHGADSSASPEAGPDKTSGGTSGGTACKPLSAAELERRFRDKHLNAEKGGEALHHSFASWQVARRLLMNLPLLCPSCWLDPRFCVCPQVLTSPIPDDIILWLYTHPKEFLIANNTGKLLPQVVGERNARLVVSGVQLQEDSMWKEVLASGPESIWCLYPSKGANTRTAVTLPWHGSSGQSGPISCLHFIVVDGTWNTAKAMVVRLQEQMSQISPGAELSFVELEEASPSVMHQIRIQPSKEKICTAAAVSRLLKELSQRPDVDGPMLMNASLAVDGALEALLNSLARRRESTGLSGLRLGVGKRNLGFLNERKPN